jgi:hypothetical protein
MDLENSTTIVQVIDPAVTTGDVNSTSVNLAGFRDVTFIVSVGESGDTLSGSVKVELEMQESSDNSNWTACANASITNAVTGTNTGTFAVIDAAAEDDVVKTSKYLGNKQYVRVVLNLTGTHTNGIPIGAVAVKSGENYKP